jgi:hypothetical protein
MVFFPYELIWPDKSLSSAKWDKVLDESCSKTADSQMKRLVSALKDWQSIGNKHNLIKFVNQNQLPGIITINPDGDTILVHSCRITKTNDAIVGIFLDPHCSN